MTDSQLSSPIHRTEEHFSEEQNEWDTEEAAEVPRFKVGKTGARLARLAVLADNIRHWEDDLGHPAAAAAVHEVRRSETAVHEVRRSETELCMRYVGLKLINTRTSISDALSENNCEDDFSGSDDDFLGFYDE
jgi:hypothetical protein